MHFNNFTSCLHDPSDWAFDNTRWTEWACYWTVKQSCSGAVSTLEVQSVRKLPSWYVLKQKLCAFENKPHRKCYIGLDNQKNVWKEVGSIKSVAVPRHPIVETNDLVKYSDPWFPIFWGYTLHNTSWNHPLTNLRYMCSYHDASLVQVASNELCIGNVSHINHWPTSTSLKKKRQGLYNKL